MGATGAGGLGGAWQQRLLTKRTGRILTNPTSPPVALEARVYRPYFFGTLIRWTIEVLLSRLAAATVLKRPVMALLPMVLVLAIGYLLMPNERSGRPPRCASRAPRPIRALHDAFGSDPPR